MMTQSSLQLVTFSEQGVLEFKITCLSDQKLIDFAFEPSQPSFVYALTEDNQITLFHMR